MFQWVLVFKPRLHHGVGKQVIRSFFTFKDATRCKAVVLPDTIDNKDIVMLGMSVQPG